MAEVEEVTTPVEEYPAVTETIESAADIVKETKAGYKSTEFYASIAAALTILFTDIPLPEDSKGLVLAALAAVYTFSRALAKKGIPSIEPPKK